MGLPKDATTTQIYFQNINGITLTDPGNWSNICEHVCDMEVDIALLAEHKLDTTQPRVMNRLYDEAQKTLGRGCFSINAASTEIASPTMYKPGGVLSLVTGGVKGRILKADRDPYGRWVSTTYHRNSGPPVTIIVTSQVIAVDPQRAGPTTYATQLFAAYTKEGRPNPTHLRKHHADNLVAFVKQRQGQGEWIIIAGDINEVLGIETGGMTKLHSECGLVDACLDKHGITDFSTYQRGTTVIDYILVNQNVIQCVQAVGYEPFGLHILSDHRGLFLDIASPQCFGSTLLPLQPIQLRDISTKRSHQIAPYFWDKMKHLQDHHWFQKLADLKASMCQNQPDHLLAEALYEQLIAASIYAGSKLKKFPLVPYSPTIARLWNVHRLLKLAVTQFKTSKNMSDSIARTKAKLGDAGYELPGTLELCTQVLHRCTRQLKAAIREELATNNLRRQHQDQRIEHHEAAGNTKLAKKIRGMKNAESTKRVFQRCRAARNLGAEGGLTHVLVPDNPNDNPRTCDHWRRIDCPKEMTQ